MKKIFSLILQIVLIIGSVAIQSSCSEDFLTKQPPASLAGASVETPEGVEASLVGAYASTTRGAIFGSVMGCDWVYASCASDDCYKGTIPGDQPSFNQVEQYNVLTNLDYLAQRWRDCYNGVSRCNSTLDFLKTVQTGSNPVDATRATQIEAEAKYLRAWFHFAANRVFKNIPYIKTQDEQDGKWGDEIPNTDQGWTDMEADLTFAINNLPESFPGEPGRATKYAALTLMAQAKLYQGKYGEAAPLLDQIINSNRYQLVDNYYDNYNEDTENNAESIFELQCSASSAGETSLRLTIAVQFTSGPAAQGGWGFYQPSQSLVDAFMVNSEGLPYLDVNTRPHFPNDMGIESPGEYPRPGDLNPWEVPIDLRMDWTVSRRGVDYQGWGIMGGDNWIRDQPNGGPWMTTKYTVFEKNNSAQSADRMYNNRNFRYFRYAHVLLWRAECYVEAGEFDNARELVNMVRERAKNSTPVMGLYTGKRFTYTGTIPSSDYFASLSTDDPYYDPNYVYETVDWDKPAANYQVGLYPAGHAAFATKESAREAVRMEIRLEFATEGQRFFDLRRWGQFTDPVNGRPYDVHVLSDYITRDNDFRTVMRGSIYNEGKRYWPVPQAQIDLQMGVLTQDPNY